MAIISFSFLLTVVWAGHTLFSEENAETTCNIQRGNYLSFLKKIQNTQLLIIDDFGLTPIDKTGRRALLDIIEHKYDKASIIFTTQIPVENWHKLIG